MNRVVEVVTRVTPMRRVASFALALLLTAAGAGSLLYLLFLAPGWNGWFAAGAAFVLGAGVTWLYADLTDVAATPNL